MTTANYSPAHGRRYDIYHNQVQVGRLEVSAYMKGDVNANLNVQRARLLAIATIRDFLGVIALHICDPVPKSDGYRQAQAAIQNCFTDTLWQTQKITEIDDVDYGDIDLRLEGAASFYFDRGDSEAFAERRARLR